MMTFSLDFVGFVFLLFDVDDEDLSYSFSSSGLYFCCPMSIFTSAGVVVLCPTMTRRFIFRS
jgi:hypothetical protein